MRRRGPGGALRQRVRLLQRDQPGVHHLAATQNLASDARPHRADAPVAHLAYGVRRPT
ncbi:hypothetical protein [Streptomyces sp. S4.7]|uniref:hypothetical protein n=1 Tax=Streptomyces sp. S4.7 TaxID=2705439 RepID=UPI0013DCFCF4|nr:hypothetical protein [Streptomyces sp. S4.7]